MTQKLKEPGLVETAKLLATAAELLARVVERAGNGDNPEESPADQLTIRQVGERLHRSPSTVRGWVGRGEFPGAVKVLGRSWLVPLAAVTTFLERQRSKMSTEDSVSRTIAQRAESGVGQGRARRGETADLSAWRRVWRDQPRTAESDRGSPGTQL